MNLQSIQKIYFLGIGGIGMSALARYFTWIGKTVSGYDKVCSDLTRTLQSEGISIHYDNNSISEIPDDLDLIIYTPAIAENDKWFTAVRNIGVPMMKRAEVLGLISRNIPTIAVAGTHGKTTITTMIAHIFKVAGIEFSAFMGGISSNYNTNFLASKKPQWIVVEADEFDRSFLHLNPAIAVITSIDPDHLDIYHDVESIKESFNQFVNNIQPDGHLVIQHDVKDVVVHPQQTTYGLNPSAQFHAQNVYLEYGQFYWEFETNSGTREFTLGMPGKHNVENSVAAAAVATLAGVRVDFISKAFRSYRGVKRRFDIKLKKENIIYIDDYAHHPAEIKACINSAREMFPGKKITGVFQPHLYSRTRDLADDFGKALNLLDEIIILDIYPAREEPIQGINARYLLDKINNPEKKYIPYNELLLYIGKRNFELLITMGAGDIDRLVEPIKIILERC